MKKRNQKEFEGKINGYQKWQPFTCRTFGITSVSEPKEYKSVFKLDLKSCHLTSCCLCSEYVWKG